MEVVKENTRMSQEVDEDLLEIISWKEDLNTRNEAFAEFYKRYKGFLYSIIEAICSKFPNSNEMTSAIFSNVTINVYEYSGSFNYEGDKAAESVRNKIEAWLVGIAKTELKALLSNYKFLPDEEQLAYKKMLSATTNKNSGASYNEEIVSKAFSQLKERDQHILRTYWLFYEKGEGAQAKNLPPDVLDELAKKYETNPINIRQIISRCNAVVREYLKKNYKPNK